tara:strand:+ start:1637 stop:2215 length:579 start_codon:yes stop_codon:yes gene_type:complete
MTLKKRTYIIFLISSLLVVLFSVLIFLKLKSRTEINFPNHKPNIQFVEEVENKVVISMTPKFIYSYALMKNGVYQHLDRNYTYDYIPTELKNSILFQPIHRPSKGTVLKIELYEPATIYFFFHYTADGGYSKIFQDLNGWEKCNDAPKYDIYNGDHGLKMNMYKMTADKGTYMIPPTIEDSACFNIVFNFNN